GEFRAERAKALSVVAGVAAASGARAARAGHGRRQRRLPVDIINDEVIDVVVEVGAALSKQVVEYIPDTVDVYAELDRVRSARERHVVGELRALLFRIRRALQEVRFAEIEGVLQSDIRGAAIDRGARLARERRLADLEFEIARVLEAKFVEHCWRDGRGQARSAPVHLDAIIAVAGPAARHGRLRLNASRREPAQTVIVGRETMLAVDLLINLRDDEILIPFLYHVLTRWPL